MRSLLLCLASLLLFTGLSWSEPKTLSLEQTLELLETKLLVCETNLLKVEQRMSDLTQALWLSEANSLSLESELQKAFQSSENLKAQIKDLSTRLGNVSSLLETSEKRSETIDFQLQKQVRLVKWQRIGLWTLIGVVVVKAVVIAIK